VDVELALQVDGVPLMGVGAVGPVVEEEGVEGVAGVADAVSVPCRGDVASSSAIPDVGG